MKKEDELIMVVKRGALFGKENSDHFEGFKKHPESSESSKQPDHETCPDYEKRILDNFIYMRRGDAENNPEYKQPIAYCIVRNPIQNKIFAFQRSKKDANYYEKRLQGKWAWGVGGHIDKVDLNEVNEVTAGTDSKGFNLSNSNQTNPNMINYGIINSNPIHSSMLRELKEEIGLGSIAGFKKIGYINCESTAVDKVHFGILYVVDTHSEIISPAGNELESGMLRTLAELEEIYESPDYNVESWSKIAFEPLKNIMNN